MRCIAVYFLFLLVLFAGTKVQCQLTYASLKVEYDSAWTFKNLQLIPIRFRDQPTTNVTEGQPFKHSLSLAEALAKGKAKIKEVIYENGADLNWLEILNTSKQPLIINSGDLLEGGKQDRMIGETKIIPPGKSDYLKVYCIEKGRWDDKVKSFHHSGSANTEMKKTMDLTGRQAEVWKEIERQFASEKKTSDTWPYLKLHNAAGTTDSSYIKYFTDKFSRSDSAYAGFLAITKDRIINCELFASTDLTNIAFRSILSSLVQSVLTSEPPSVNHKTMKAFLDNLLESEASQKSFIASHGQVHKYEGRVIHLIAYGD